MGTVILKIGIQEFVGFKSKARRYVNLTAFSEINSDKSYVVAQQLSVQIFIKGGGRLTPPRTRYRIA